uniref:Uncharacterized protein n=1 Tax=Romanomermis culicivorax TaxID=13658 RepID=A0A915HHX1_ROMCU
MTSRKFVRRMSNPIENDLQLPQEIFNDPNQIFKFSKRNAVIPSLEFLNEISIVASSDDCSNL